jgi:hypothetical protein
MSNYLSDYSALNGELAQALSDSFTLESFIEHQINHDQKLHPIYRTHGNHDAGIARLLP